MTIAVFFLFLCLLMIRLLSAFEGGLLTTMLSEGLTIIGWVAMWEPIYVFLYGWWPIVHKRNVYRKILDMNVNVISGSPYEVVKRSDNSLFPESHLFPNKS